MTEVLAVEQALSPVQHRSDPTEISSDLLQAVVDLLPFGVSVHTEDGTCVLANRAALAFARVSSADDARANREGASPVLETRKGQLETTNGPFTLETTVDVSAQRRVESDLFAKAYVDGLTGLPNTAFAKQAMADLVAGGAAADLAVFLINIDGFKHVNDLYGHAMGDALIVKIGARLSGLLDEGDLLARAAGDQFVLVVPVLQTDLGAKLDLFAGCLKQPIFVQGQEIFVSASIGASLYPDHGRDFDTLFRKAETAMVRVKSKARGGAAVFDDSMAQAASQRMELEQKLRLALRDHRLCCAFQPKVDLHSREVKGVEVLLRWRDDNGVARSPGEMVTLAIELGLINEVTWVVLDETIRLLDVIDDTFGANSTISLNVAAKQAEDVPFMLALVDRLAETGCAHRFMVELTEEAFFQKSRFQTQVLPSLRRIGTRVSIDDFGVGYSSLAALADIEADEIKIDRSFVTNIHQRPRNQSILRAILSLSEALGMSVTAEGVETAEELAFLRDTTGVQLAQGFYFARPVLLEKPPALIPPAGSARSEARASARPRNVPLRSVGSRRT